TSGDLQLKAAGPDAATSALLSTDLSNYFSNNCAPIAVFEAQSGDPGRFGTITGPSTVTFTLWMRVTGPSGAIFPCVELDYGSGIWIGNASTQLTTTLTKYTITATLASNATIAATDRPVLRVNARIQNQPSFTSQAELDIEGTSGGNYD